MSLATVNYKHNRAFSIGPAASEDKKYGFPALFLLRGKPAPVAEHRGPFSDDVLPGCPLQSAAPYQEIKALPETVAFYLLYPNSTPQPGE
jgi:hypothetical protein